jgi:hypothetical protein
MAHISFISASKLAELLGAADKQHDMHVRVLTTNQLALGVDPLHPTTVIDLSKEVVRSLTGDDEAAVGPPSGIPSPTRRPSRQTGNYPMEILGQRVVCISLKHLLSEGLKRIEAHQQGTLDKLSRVKKRTKRIVARDRAGLFDKVKLQEKYSEKLTDGWWFGTNNSADETKAWLQQACYIARLEWGKDFRALMPR